MRTKTLAACAAVLALTACAVPISDKAAKIQVHSQMSTLLNACQKLGPVTGTAKAVWEQPDTEARIAARDRVSELGGDTLVVTNIDRFSALTGYTSTVHGVAMRCY